MPVNLWDLAIEQQKQGGGSSSTSHKEKTLLFVGSKQVGKTTLIQTFLGRQEATRPTLALEYTYGRKANHLGRDVCHVWELGGGTLSLNLLETPMSPPSLESLRVVLVVDLSDPGRLWFTLEMVTSALSARLSKKEPAAAPDHPDAGSLRPFPIPLVILGAKYDVFRDFEPEKKKIVCKTLRFFAHHHAATLQFYSARDSALVSKAKDLLAHHAFGGDLGKGVSHDYNKPLVVPAWSDSFEAITGSSGNKHSLEMWKCQFTTHFPQTVTEATALPEDPAKDLNFREPMIDEMKAQKDDDLERFRRDAEQKNTGWGDYFDRSSRFS